MTDEDHGLLETPPGHRSGFVNIVGRPNVGKSTLMNALVGERMSIITPKPQTTRHRIIGILNGDNSQIVFSDTPGMIDDPAYGLHQAMNASIRGSFEDADIILFVTELGEQYPDDHPVIERLGSVDAPVFLVINKTDLGDAGQVEAMRRIWTARVDFQEVVPISALQGAGIDRLLERIRAHLPEGPVYYPKEQLTDRDERFFVAETIREKILLLYHQEIPYYSEVIVDSFKETKTRDGEDLVRIRALIFVGRRTQKAILIGKGGSAIKQLGQAARKDLEKWLGRKVYLELHVKVRDDWRDEDRWLRQFGYKG